MAELARGACHDRRTPPGGTGGAWQRDAPDRCRGFSTSRSPRSWHGSCASSATAAAKCRWSTRRMPGGGPAAADNIARMRHDGQAAGQEGRADYRYRGRVQRPFARSFVGFSPASPEPISLTFDAEQAARTVRHTARSWWARELRRPTVSSGSRSFASSGSRVAPRPALPRIA